MTVRELIDKLNDMPADAEVWVATGRGYASGPSGAARFIELENDGGESFVWISGEK